jgi:hypothetical protein
MVPQAVPVIEPVTGLPPQVIAQSTPAPRLSFTGDIDRDACWLISRDIGCCEEAPPAIDTEIGLACTRELLEHAERNIASTQITVHMAESIPVLPVTNPHYNLAA